MKKLILATFAIALLGACNNKKAENKAEDTTTTTTTPMTTGWDAGNRTSFMSQCMEGTKSKMTAEKAQGYCECMSGKLEARYPVFDSTSNMTMAQMQEVASDCKQ
jgi:hypothetical protein